jgi:hypothetical protein
MAGHVIIFDLHVPHLPLLFIPHIQRLFLSCTAIWSLSSVLLECLKKTSCDWGPWAFILILYLPLSLSLSLSLPLPPLVLQLIRVTNIMTI